MTAIADIGTGVGASSLTPSQRSQRLQTDVWHVHNRTFWLLLKVTSLTIGRFLLDDGERGASTAESEDHVRLQRLGHRK